MADAKTRMAATNLSALMTAPDDELDGLRSALGPAAASRPQIERLREVLLALADYLHDGPERLERLTRASEALRAEARAAETPRAAPPVVDDAQDDIDAELREEGTMELSLAVARRMTQDTALPFRAAEPLPFRAAAADDSSPDPLLTMTVESYASLCALAQAYPESSAETHRRFGVVDPTARRRLDEMWRARFTMDGALYELWSALYGQFHGWLVANRT
jgi:hypothetical protein